MAVLSNFVTVWILVFWSFSFRKVLLGATEDSYDIHTFESYDLAGVLSQHRNNLINSFTEAEQLIVRSVMDTSVARKQRIENQLRYLFGTKK